MSLYNPNFIINSNSRTNSKNSNRNSKNSNRNSKKSKISKNSKNSNINSISIKQSSFFELSNKSKYLYNLYKSPQFKSITNALPNIITNDFKQLLKKLYLQFKEHEPIINKINIENSRTIVSSKNATIKITHILKTIFINNRYIDNTIFNYINTNINKCTIISYENTINEQTFTFNFIIYEKINLKKLNYCVKAMLLILQVIISISNNKKVTASNTSNICNINGLQLNIFMTHFAKKFDLDSSDVLGAKNINSGLTHPCLKTGEIYIYRKHEFFKVFIHETLHSYNVDLLLRNNYDSNTNYQSLINTFNIAHFANSYNKIGLNESITEFWTFIIHIFVYCYNKSSNLKTLEFYFERFYKYEVIHSYFQVAKILYKNNLSYSQFLRPNAQPQIGTVLYNEDSHILSYIFFKTLLVFNVNKVIQSNIFNFKIHSLDLVDLDIKMSAIDDLFIMLKNFSLNNDAHTIINNSYTIYKNYIALLKPVKKITLKKVPLLKLYTKKQIQKNKTIYSIKKSSNLNKFNKFNNLNFLITNLNFMFVDYVI